MFNLSIKPKTPMEAVISWCRSFMLDSVRTFLHRLQSHHHLVMVFIPFYRNVYEWKKRFWGSDFQTWRQISWWIITLKHEWNGTRSKETTQKLIIGIEFERKIRERRWLEKWMDWTFSWRRVKVWLKSPARCCYLSESRHIKNSFTHSFMNQIERSRGTG